MPPSRPLPRHPPPGPGWEREAGDVRIACGTERPGIAGFRRSHQEAQELIGHDVSTRLAEVLAALETAHALGSAVLTDAHDDLHGSGSRRA